MTTVLGPIAWLYGRFADARNALYERGWLTSYPLGAKTISIGNITAGGTGKTPLVALVAEILAEKGETACILTRGYGRDNPGERVLVSDGERVFADVKMGGDEPVELARRLIGKAAVVADADRVSAAAWAKEKFRATAFVLDDAFQHRRARRDLDIVCIDATNPFDNGKILPAGKLRESIASLQRADVVVVTRTNLAAEIERIKSQVRKAAPEARIFLCENRISRVTPVELFLANPNGTGRNSRCSEGEIGWTEVRVAGELGGHEEVRLLAFCALGNPNSFFLQMMDEFEKRAMDDFDLSITKSFPDHHYYTQSDIDKLVRQTLESNVHAMVTTAKDAAKLAGLTIPMPCFVVEIEFVLDDFEAFRNLF